MLERERETNSTLEREREMREEKKEMGSRYVPYIKKRGTKIRESRKKIGREREGV